MPYAKPIALVVFRPPADLNDIADLITALRKEGYAVKSAPGQFEAEIVDNREDTTRR